MARRRTSPPPPAPPSPPPVPAPPSADPAVRAARRAELEAELARIREADAEEARNRERVRRAYLYDNVGVLLGFFPRHALGCRGTDDRPEYVTGNDIDCDRCKLLTAKGCDAWPDELDVEVVVRGCF